MFQVVRTIPSTAVCIWWLQTSFLKVNEGSLSYPVFQRCPSRYSKTGRTLQRKRQQLFPLRLTWQWNDEIKWNYRWVVLEEQGAVGKRAGRQKCHSCVRVDPLLVRGPFCFSIVPPLERHTGTELVPTQITHHYKHTEMWQIIMLFATAIARGSLDECLFLVCNPSLKCIILMKNTFPN